MDNSKKSFSIPADTFFQQEQTAPEPTTEAVKKQDKRFNLKKKELKSIRTNLLLKPSLYKQIKAISDKNKMSVNEVINQILEQFFNE